jgi:hypothetical protein
VPQAIVTLRYPLRKAGATCRGGVQGLECAPGAVESGDPGLDPQTPLRGVVIRQNHNTPIDLADPPLPAGDGVFLPAFIPSTRAERIAEARALARPSFRKPRRPRRPSTDTMPPAAELTADDELARWRRKHAR